MRESGMASRGASGTKEGHVQGWRMWWIGGGRSSAVVGVNVSGWSCPPGWGRPCRVATTETDPLKDFPTGASMPGMFLLHRRYKARRVYSGLHIGSGPFSFISGCLLIPLSN